MKLLLATSYFLPHKGGLENYTYNIAKRLIKKGVSINLLCCQTEKGSKDYEIFDEIKIYRLPSWHILGKTYPIPKPTLKLFKILNQLKKENFDFVNYHTRFFVLSLVSFLFAKIHKIPSVITEHGSCHSYLGNFFTRSVNIIYDHIFGWLVTKFADFNLAVSKAAGEFSKHLGAEKYEVIYNGIDSKFWESQDLQKLNQVVFVGRLIKAKGAQDLINAFHKIKNNNYQLIIIGDGPYKSELIKLAADNSKIIFVGQKNSEEIRNILSKSKILVNPSYSEGLPTCVLEGGITKNVVIATDVGGTKEIIKSQEYGFTFAPKNVPQLKDILEKVMDNQEAYKNQTEKLFYEIKKEYDWDIVSEKFYNFLKQNKRLKTINIITPFRKGGPWSWGQQLASEINKTNEYQAQHKHKLIWLLFSPFYQKADIVHTSIPISWRWWHKPTILTIHGDFKKEKNIFSKMYPEAIKKANLVTVPSEFLKKELSLNNAVVIPNGVEPRRVQHQQKSSLYFLTVTNFHFIDKAKGVLNILECLKKIDAKFEYHILGMGEFLEQTKKEARKLNLENVYFEGFQETNRFYEKADIFLYNSQHDNMPIVIMEAMAHGIPVVTNEIGAVDEIIDHKINGLIAKTKDDYCQYLKEIVENVDLRQRIRAGAYDKIKGSFAWPHVIEKWINLYNQL